MKMALITLIVLFLLKTRVDASLNGRPVVPGAWDLSCTPVTQSWIQKTCEWNDPPFLSEPIPGAAVCADLCQENELCASGRYDMWTGLCELSEESCKLVKRNHPHYYLVAFVRVANNPPVPQDDCFIVRKERGVGSRDGVPSFVQCRPGEVVTECDCERGRIPGDPPKGSCTGITVSHSGTRCNAWGGTTAIPGQADTRDWLVVAVASCGRLLTGDWTVTSYPETGFTSEPSVQCPNGENDTVLFGCYVNSDGTVEGFETERVMTQGVRDGSTCRAPPGCTACQVTVVCAPGTYPGKWHGFHGGNCLCSTVDYGPWRSEANTYSQGMCIYGEVLTSCECEGEDGEPCNGALVWPQNHFVSPFVCRAFKTAIGPRIRAKACCSKVGGSVWAIWDPPHSWSQSVVVRSNPSAAVGKETPRAVCKEGYIVIGCTVFSPDGSYVERFTSSDWSNEEEIRNVCTTYSGHCNNCIASAICFKREQCEGTASDYGEFGPWSECDGEAENRRKYCDSPGKPDSTSCGSEKLEAAKPVYETRACTAPPAFKPYLLVGVDGGLDRVDFDGTTTRVTRVQHSFGEIWDIAYDYHANYIFYVAATYVGPIRYGYVPLVPHALRRCSLTGENDKTLVSYYRPYILHAATDTIGKQLWFSTHNKIWRSDYNGDYMRVIHDRSPWFTLDLSFHAEYSRDAQKWERRIFWREIGSIDEGRIMSSTSTGSDIQTLVPVHATDRSSTAMSLSGSLLYWMVYQELRVVDIHTKEQRSLGVLPQMARRAMYAHGEFLYIVDTGHNVKRVNVSDPDFAEEIFTNKAYDPMTVVLVHDDDNEDRIQSNGGWSAWEPWTDCTWPCQHTGIRTRRRHCEIHPPSDGCEGWDHALEPCNNGPCEGNPPPYSREETEQKERLAICKLYVNNESLVAIESEFPNNRKHAKTLNSCKTDCTNRGLKCAESLRVYPDAGKKGKQQVRKMSCTTKWSTLCCCA